MDETDIAVLEYRDHNNEWNILIRIGSDCTGGLIEEYEEGGGVYKGCDLRIRYLFRDKEQKDDR